MLKLIIGEHIYDEFKSRSKERIKKCPCKENKIKRGLKNEQI